MLTVKLRETQITGLRCTSEKTVKKYEIKITYNYFNTQLETPFTRFDSNCHVVPFHVLNDYTL